MLRPPGGDAFDLSCLVSTPVIAEGTAAQLPIGTQTIGMTGGPIFPIRLTEDQSTKLFGGAAGLSWSLTLTDPVGSSWYRGQVSLGAELIGFFTSEPSGSSGIGVNAGLREPNSGLNFGLPYIGLQYSLF